MRKLARQQDQGGAEIDLTPMLDVGRQVTRRRS